MVSLPECLWWWTPLVVGINSYYPIWKYYVLGRNEILTLYKINRTNPTILRTMVDKNYFRWWSRGVQRYKEGFSGISNAPIEGDKKRVTFLISSNILIRMCELSKVGGVPFLNPDLMVPLNIFPLFRWFVTCFWLRCIIIPGVPDRVRNLGVEISDRNR